MTANDTADRHIIDLYFARSEDAIAETSARYGAYCTAIANSVLGNSADTEECVNDTYLRVWESIPPARPVSLKAYIGKITRNLAIHRYEKERAAKRGGGEIPLILSELEECVAGNASAEDRLSQAALTEALNRFLEGISRKQRIIFLRRYWYNASVAEIASQLAISETAVKSTLHRLRIRLKQTLEKEGIL